MLWFKKKAPAEQIIEIKRIFREVFGSESGKVVLSIMLEDMRYFSIAVNEEDVALRNYASVLLRDRLGIVDHHDITQALMTVKHE